MSAISRIDGRGREGVGPAREVLLDDVVLRRALERRGVDAVLLRGDDVEREQPRRRRVDRHRRVHAVERDAVEQRAHVALVARSARRPCRPRRARARGRRRSPSASAGRRRSRARSAPWPGCGGTARSSARPSSAPRTSASSRACRGSGRRWVMGRFSRIGYDSAPCARSTRGTSGVDKVICCWEVDGVLVDPGPESTLETVLEALGGEAPRARPAHPHPLRPRRRERARSCAAGPTCRSTSTSAARAHMVAPGAARGQRRAAVRRRGGAAAAVGRGRAGAGGATCTVLTRRRDACSATSASSTRPGHASHHVSYLHEPTGTAFVGDVAGVRIPPARATCSRRRRRPTSTSRRGTRSLDLVAGWEPAALALTHFGRVDDVGPHLARGARAAARDRSRSPPGTARRRSRPAIRERVAAHAPDLAAQYEQAAPPEHLYLGVRRYLDKRARRG